MSVKLTGLNAIGNDYYFIRLTDRPKYFVHLESTEGANITYIIKKGTNGACAFSKEQGEEWIKASGAENLELIKVMKVLKNDGTLN